MKIITTHPAPTDGREVRSVLRLDEYIDALRPIFALLGLEPTDVCADGFAITERTIEFRSSVPIAGIEPVPSSEDAQVAFWVWPVRITVTRP